MIAPKQGQPLAESVLGLAVTQNDLSKPADPIETGLSAHGFELIIQIVIGIGSPRLAPLSTQSRVGSHQRQKAVEIVDWMGGGHVVGARKPVQYVLGRSLRRQVGGQSATKPDLCQRR